MLAEWALAKVAAIRDQPRVIVRDPSRLLPENGGALHRFGIEHGFTVIVASTNLAFRSLYEEIRDSDDIQKLMLVDRAPARRRATLAPNQAPPPFYPDLLAETPPEARIELDLRQFLRDQTGEEWPKKVNERPYPRLIVQHLEGVLQAHRNLRAADKSRFTDDDFTRVVAYAALGVPEAAFTRLGARAYWKIGLVGHDALAELDDLAPQITRAIRDELRAAPWPFSLLAGDDPDRAVHAFYTSIILAQHFDRWRLLLPNVDPALQAPADVDAAALLEAAVEVTALGPTQAARDLEEGDQALSKEALQQLVDEARLAEPAGVGGAARQQLFRVQEAFQRGELVFQPVQPFAVPEIPEPGEARLRARRAKLFDRRGQLAVQDQDVVGQPVAVRQSCTGR